MGLEALGKKLAQLGADAKSGMSQMSETYQANSKINENKKTLNQLFAKLGETVFDKFADAPLEGFEEAFKEISGVKETISSLEDQVKKIRGIVVCEECGKEASKDEKFCSACGAKLPEAGIDMNNVAEKLKEDMKEAGAQVGDMVNDAADKAKGFFDSFAEKADSFVKGVSSKIKDTAEDVAEKAEDLAEDTEDFFADADDDVKEAAEEAAAEAVEEPAAEPEEPAAEPAEDPVTEAGMDMKAEA